MASVDSLRAGRPHHNGASVLGQRVVHTSHALAKRQGMRARGLGQTHRNREDTKTQSNHVEQSG